MEKTKIKYFDACNIYILLWVVGHVQQMFLNNSFISRVFYVPYLLMTIYYIFKVYVSYRPQGTMKALCLFFAVLIVYGIALLFLDNARGQARTSFLIMLFGSLGPIFPFYVFTRKGLLIEKRMMGWLWVFIVVAIIGYFVEQQKALALIMEKGREYEEITNNAAYSFAGLIPFVFLLKKRPLWQYMTLGILFYFIISGFKRGAMLVGALMLIWFVYASLKSSSKGMRFGILLLTVMAIMVGYRFITNLFENSDYFQYRIESTMEGNSSERDEIYATLWHHYIYNDNILQLAFGEGAFHTENVTGHVKAHNDWLELLIDCGLFGVLLYLVYWGCFIRDWVKSKSNPLVFAMLGSCFVFTFTRTFFSMSFSDLPFYTAMIMGYCFGESHPATVSSEENFPVEYV